MKLETFRLLQEKAVRSPLTGLYEPTDQPIQSVQHPDGTTSTVVFRDGLFVHTSQNKQSVQNTQHLE